MKKILLFTVLLVFGYTANAQEEETNSDGYGWSKGDVYISGSVGIWSPRPGDAKDNSFNIMPQVGFLVSDNIAIGGQLGFMSYTSDDSRGDTIEDANTFMIGAYGKYLFSPQNRLNPYLGVGFNYMSSKYDIGDYKSNGFEIGAGAGLIYALCESFYIGANYGILSYSTEKPDFDDAESTDTFTLGLDWKNLNFSLAYRF